MHLMNASGLLAMAPQTKPGETPPPFWTSLIPLVLLIVVFYFILIRPQQKKAKEHAAMLKTVRTGDKILTTGGLLGAVISVKEKSLNIRSGDSKLEISKSAVAEIVERSGESSDS